MNTTKELFYLMCKPDCPDPFISNGQRLDFAEHLAKHCAVVLPCNVGDVVYKVEGYYITETEVERIIVEKDCFKLKLACNDYYETRDSAIGQKIFFTREEAEKKAKKKAKRGTK